MLWLYSIVYVVKKMFAIGLELVIAYSLVYVFTKAPFVGLTFMCLTDSLKFMCFLRLLAKCSSLEGRERRLL